MILLYPGEKGELVELNEALRARHDELRAQREREIAERVAKGSPLDDQLDWEKLDLGELQAAVEARDSVRLRAAADALVRATDGALVPIEPFKEDARLAGVKAQVVILSEKQRREFARNERRIRKELRKAFTDGDDYAADRLAEELFEAQRAYVGAAVAVVLIGDASVDPRDPSSLDLLERNELIGPLYLFAAGEQELPPGKGLRSGSSPASTSSASTAPTARRTGGPHAGAMAVET